MSESLEAICNFGFEKLALTAIEAYTHRLNDPSKKLLRKHGFQLSHDKTDPENEDNLVYTLNQKD